MNMKWAVALAVFLTFLPLAHAGRLRTAQATASQHSAAYLSAQQKLNAISTNGRLPHPQPKTTVLTTEELNAYLAEGGVTLPDGVQRAHVSSVPGAVTASARIDFDRLLAARKITNPLMAAIFTGVHDVSVEAQAFGSNGMGTVHIESVAFDGVRIPRMAMEWLVDYYLKPKYGPNVGLDSRFRLPAHIDAAEVGQNQVVVTQK